MSEYIENFTVNQTNGSMNQNNGSINQTNDWIKSLESADDEIKRYDSVGAKKQVVNNLINTGKKQGVDQSYLKMLDKLNDKPDTSNSKQFDDDYYNTISSIKSLHKSSNNNSKNNSKNKNNSMDFNLLMNVADSLNLSEEDKKDIYKKTLQYITNKDGFSDFSKSMGCNWDMNCGLTDESNKPNNTKEFNTPTNDPNNAPNDDNNPKPTSVTLPPKNYQENTNKSEPAPVVGSSTATSYIDPNTGKYVTSISPITYHDPTTYKTMP